MAERPRGDLEASRTLVTPVDDRFAVIDSTPDAPLPTGPARGEAIEQFLVIERIGEGAMGVVVSAYDPGLDRRVAIKLLKLDTRDEADARTARTWLLREARAMARLSHPNVVAVHAVGTTPEAVFVAMEFVDGPTLSAWLAERPRPWREVVEVFAQAGRGLEAAHAAGIVHRDFKPDNVLIRRDGRVCVSDFGLASASGTRVREEGAPPGEAPPLGETTPLMMTLTIPGALLGTPAYMAPEQHLRKPASPRSDQFAFSVALHRALFGEAPFAGSNYAELRESVLAGRARTPPTNSPVPRWLREIALRGLAVDPAARFPSMTALLAALTADPDAARRRRLRAAGAVGIVVTLAGAAAIVASWARAAPACPDARRELAGAWDDARRAGVRGALVATGRPYAGDTAARVERALDAYADGWAAMRAEACAATRVEGRQSQAVLDLRGMCLERRRAELGALSAQLASGPDPEVLDSAVAAAGALTPLAACADVQALTAAVPPPEAPATRAQVDALRRRLDEAEALGRTGKHEAGRVVAASIAEDARAVAYRPVQAEALYQLGSLEEGTGDERAAEASLSDALLASAEARSDVLSARTWIALVYVVGYRQGRHEEAYAMRRGAEAAVARAGGDPLIRAELLHTFGLVLAHDGKYDDARRDLLAALSVREKLLPADAPEIAASLSGIGVVLGQLGDYEGGLSDQERALALRERALGPEHPDVASSLNKIGVMLDDLGRYEASRKSYERALAIWEKAHGPVNRDVASCSNNLGATLLHLGLYREAEAAFARARFVYEQTVGPFHRNVAMALTNMGEVLELRGDHEAARARYAEAVAVFDKALPPGHVDFAYPLTGLGESLLGLGRAADAIPPLSRALALREGSPGDPGELATTRFALARALWDAGKDRARARSLGEQARAGLVGTSDHVRKKRAAIDAWLASRSAGAR